LAALRWISKRIDLALAGTLLLAAAARGLQLSQPARLYFDEFYARDACVYLGWPQTVCGQSAEVTWMHPPLGKWFISTGIALFGFEPIAWRLASVVAGIALVGLVYVLGLRLTNSRLGAALAAGLLALDPLAIDMSRIAMLDIFTAAAGTACILFVVLDARTAAMPGRRHSRLVRPWRLAAGVAAGIAAATKWSGLLIVAVAVFLAIAYELSRARETIIRPGRRWSVTAPAGSVFVHLIAVPTVIYLLTYAGRISGDLLAIPWDQNAWVRHFVERQGDMLAFHFSLDRTHPYASPAWTWLLAKRPVVLFHEPLGGGGVREILTLVDPLVWLPALVAGLTATVMAIRAGTWWRPEVVIGASVAGTYLPWLIFATDRAQVFAYYTLPILPFLAVALAWATTRLPRRAGRVLAATLAAVAVSVYMFWAPLIYGWPIDQDTWRARMLFADCGSKADVLPSSRGARPPPSGWCWI
jgi:dolichyl-phosphate-mannose-protein mannosyltransferase